MRLSSFSLFDPSNLSFLFLLTLPSSFLIFLLYFKLKAYFKAWFLSKVSFLFTLYVFVMIQFSFPLFFSKP